MRSSLFLANLAAWGLAVVVVGCSATGGSPGAGAAGTGAAATTGAGNTGTTATVGTPSGTGGTGQVTLSGVGNVSVLSTPIYDAGGCVVHIHSKQAGTSDWKRHDETCGQSIDWTATPDAGIVDAWTPPATETFTCPAGTIRVHLHDIWSPSANPRLSSAQDQTSAAPLGVMLGAPGQWNSTYPAREDANNCSWYSVCLPTSLAESGFTMYPIGADGCASNSGAGLSGTFTLTAAEIGSASDVWLDYQGSAGGIDTAYQAGTVGTTNAFDPITDKSNAALAPTLCPASVPSESVPTGYVKLHVRWPWGNPSATGYAGSDCESLDNLSTPPFPSSIRVELGINAAGCNSNLMPGLLEFANGNCPWYDVLIPTSAWTAAGQALTDLYGRSEHRHDQQWNPDSRRRYQRGRILACLRRPPGPQHGWGGHRLHELVEANRHLGAL